MKNAIALIAICILATSLCLGASQEQKIEYNCLDFGKVRTGATIPDPDKPDEILFHVAIDEAPANAFYVGRVWPEGRHVGDSMDIVIGQLDKGESERGELLWKATEPKTYEADIDVDIWQDEDDYDDQTMLASWGQCDPGKREITYEPKVDEGNGDEGEGSGGRICHMDAATVTATLIEGADAANHTGPGHENDFAPFQDGDNWICSK